MTITAISRPLPGERILELSPADAAAAARTWLHRPNLFPGRALTATTLAAHSAWAAGHVAQRGQAFTPGVVNGLEVGLEVGRAEPGRGAVPPSLRLPKGEPIARLPYYLRIAAGRGLMATGEDVVLPHEVRIRIDALPVVAPLGVLAGVDGFGSDDGSLQPRAVGVGPEQNFGALAGHRGTVLPRAGVLVLQAVSTEQAGGDEADPCDRCACDDDGVSFDDWRIADGARLVWYAWPVDAAGYSLPAAGPQFRNRLAWSVFDAERRLPADALLPWEPWGVALAVIGLDDDHRPAFVDSAAVRRRGGLARYHRLQLAGEDGSDGVLRLGSSARLPALWQAQIEQLAEQIAETDGGQPDPYALGEALARLPPCGLLPRSVVGDDFQSTALLPDGMLVDVAPIPLEQLDLALREAAPLSAFDKQPGERLRLLVPVPQASFEPRLLETEIIDPLFAETLQGFIEARARALAARQVLREKAVLLVRALRGVAPPVPAIGADPQAIEPESIDSLFVPPGNGGHRTLLLDGPHGHRLYVGSDTALQAKDQLYVWLQLDPDHPPRSVELIWETLKDYQSFSRHRAYWGEPLLPANETPPPVARVRAGDLPEAGRWLRLAVPVSSLKLGDPKASIGWIEFRVFDGRAAFGESGIQRGKADLPLVKGRPPISDGFIGNEPLEGLLPLEVLHPFEDTLGVTVGSGGWSELLCVPVNDFLIRGGLQRLSGREYMKFFDFGVERFVQYLNERVDRADDIVDLGFAKVQADIYRIRQLVLDTTDANRLGVSSALAGITQTETSTVSNERLGRFFGELSQRSGVAPPPPSVPLPPPPSPTTVPRAPVRPRIQLQAQTQIKAVAKAPVTLRAAPARVASTSPLIGNFSLRSVSIAERLKRPPALEALEFAVATRHEVVSNLLRLADALGGFDNLGIPDDLYENTKLFDGLDLWLLDIEVPPPSVGSKQLNVPFSRFLNRDTRSTELARLLKVPQRQTADEGSNFSDASDITDRTVALLRQFEGCIQRYRDVIDDCEDLQTELRGYLSAAGVRERAWQDRLDEARHDVAVTRALILDEQARLDAINARRAAVLKDEFRFAAFIRPRTADTLDAALSRPLDPGLLPAPVPACLAEHDDAPDELRELLLLLREAPARWFGQGPRLIEGLDRIDLLVRTVQHAQTRAGIAAQRASLVPTAAATGLPASIAKVQAAQRQAVTAARAATLLDPSRLALGGWQAARRDAADVISLGDLIDGDHGRNAVSRAAADFFDRCSRVCGCLHGAFSAVLPAIRLDWAETLSQFDDAPNLRNLASLPRYSELAFADRRRLQGLVDWLFDQIEINEPRAQALVNDLVRMCLLLASHAPIGRIIAGRMARPVTARPGVRIALQALEPARLRIGMQALIHRNGVLVARAEVEDLGESEVSARVIHTAAAMEALDDGAQVQFTEAAALGTPKRGLPAPPIRTR